MKLFGWFRKGKPSPQALQPHPPGTRCVVTFVPMSATSWQVGDVVTVGELTCTVATDDRGHKVHDFFQETDRPGGVTHPFLVYFVKYLRKLDDDITDDDREIAHIYSTKYVPPKVKA